MKKICLTICGIVGMLLCGPTIQGRTTEIQNDNILLNESSICLESSDMKVGDYVCWLHSGTRCDEYMTVAIYESNGACGNYYARIAGESYKVQRGEWRRYNTSYEYSFVYNGCRYVFEL